MCGITGLVDCSSLEPQKHEQVLKAMTDVIVHRGPDSEGQWISDDGRCGLGFRRLSIIDLSQAGNQPMSTPDGRFTIIFNGEIYNHAELREDLKSKGYKYRSKTDTETLLYGYQEYGKDFLNMLLGMWGMAIWDNEKKELFCARDRIGIKPLYYTYQNGKFIFGSEIKSILQNPSVIKEFNLEELPNYLNFGMSSNRTTMFKHINKIPAGHYVTINLNGEFKLERYWSPIAQDLQYTDMSEEEIQKEIIRILRRAIKDRMMSDVPFGVFLSGGIDSSLNVALMAELMDRPVETFTVGFKELEKYNELEYARLIAKRYKTSHHEILIDHNDALPILNELVWHEDEPNADPVCIPLWFLCKLTHDSGTTVIQVGEGSDEQFVGYPWMLREYNFYNSYWKFYTSLPEFLRKGAYHTIKPFLKMANQSVIQEYFRRGTFGEQLYWGGASIYSPSHFEGLFTPRYQYLNRNPAEFAMNMHRQALAFKEDADYLQRILYVELSERLSEILLMRVDKIGMAHSLEARVPFLDHRLVEFSMSIPPHIKTPDAHSTKHILKKAVKGILPDEIINRKKQGFWAPVNEWLRNDWYDYAYNEITTSELMLKGVFNELYIKKMFELHKSGKQNNGLKIFTLLTLVLWYKRFFN